MRTLRTLAELRAALSGPRHAGQVIGLVPTMGAFHDGHLSLMRRAREECDEVVVSLFVNPTQFEDPTDLAAYRRDEHHDAVLAAAVGVDHLFAPAHEQVYPTGFATSVSVGGMSERLEGAHRGARHFDGVSTVVTKLLNMVAPQVAYFGQKDVQQTIVIKRLVRDLDLPVRIEVCPTVREPDGLAMSSRNARLFPAERTRAASLHRALLAVQAAVAAGACDPAAARTGGLEELTRAGVTPEYLELVAADTLTPVERIEGHVLAVLAATVGTTRLIDNEMIHVRPSAHAVANHQRREALTCSARC